MFSLVVEQYDPKIAMKLKWSYLREVSTYWHENLQNPLYDTKLVHNLFENVSKWVTFLWQRQIQMDQKETNSFIPSDINFQTILTPKVILAKILSQRIYSNRPFLSWVCFRKE